MACNAIFTKRRRREAGVTLVEMLITLGLSGLVFVAVGRLIFYTGRSFAGLLNYIELDRYSRNALDQMIYKIRQADEMTGFTTNQMTFSYYKTNTLSYIYSATDKTLTETMGGQSKVLLKGCDKLTFSIFQRNTSPGTYDQFPATMTNNAVKLVQLNWTCSRTVLGGRLNTESVQSAKIVIRNQ